MIAQSGEELVRRSTRTVTPCIRKDVVMVILADIDIHRGSAAIGVVIIPCSGDEVRVPALDQVGHV
jgi:hypothetical protein